MQIRIIFRTTKRNLELKRCFNCKYAEERFRRTTEQVLIDGKLTTVERFARTEQLVCYACRKHCMVTATRDGCLKFKERARLNNLSQ